MITYPVIFFGQQGGKIKEDFDDYDLGALPVYPQIWQYTYHQWLVKNNPNKFTAFTYKDYGISGAWDSFEEYQVGPININPSFLEGVGNFDNRSWSGVHAGFYRDTKGKFTSADQLRMLPYIYYNWGDDAPISGYKTDNWSMKMIAQFRVPCSGNFRFFIERDEACRMWIGRENGFDTLVFDKWGVPVVSGSETSAIINMNSGISNLLIHYYDDAGSAKLKLSWEGPCFTKRPMLPSDFGDENYVRVYYPFYGGLDQGNQSIDINGNYILGVIHTDLNSSDVTRNNLSFQGIYEQTLIYFDGKMNSSLNVLSASGYYINGRIGANWNDRSNNVLDGRGFYSSAFNDSYTVNGAIGQMSQAGFHGLRYLDRFTNEKTRGNINFFGFHGTGRLYVDTVREKSYSELRPEGFYTPTHLVHLEEDLAVEQIQLVGLHYPLYKYTRDKDAANQEIYLAGISVTGYPLNGTNESASNFISQDGHYAYGIVTFDSSKEVGFNTIDNRGFYVYKTISTKDGNAASTSLDFDAAYYNKYLINNADVERSLNVLDTQGLYFSRYFDNDYKELVGNEIFGSGFYASSITNFRGGDDSINNVSLAAYHITGTVLNPYNSKGKSLLLTAGNYFYQFLPYKNGDAASGVLDLLGLYYSDKSYYRDHSLSQELLDFGGNYLSRFTNHLSIENAAQIVDFQGSHSSRFLPYLTSDNASNIINPVGFNAYAYAQSQLTDYAANRVRIAANYFYRFVFGDGLDISRENINLYGSYDYGVVNNYQKDTARSIQNVNGNYIQRYVSFDSNDLAGGYFNLLGVYYPRYLLNNNVEHARESIFMYGDVYYGRVNVMGVDFGTNLISISDGVYFSRFVNAYAKSPANTQIYFVGEYARESYRVADVGTFSLDFDSEFVALSEIQDYGAIAAEVSGEYVQKSQSSTLEYWVEIYRWSPYNKGKTERYFNV